MRARRDSWLRRWSFRGLAILAGLLPFLIAELSLRWFDRPGLPVEEAIDRDPLVDLHQLRRLFVLSDDGQRWVIPPERYNFFRPASFLRSKPDDTFRIFVVGGSTVQGRPYATETAFPTFFRIHLQQLCPDRQFEVVNCGGVSYASYRVASIVDEVLDHDPNLVIVYTGHNEFLEDRTYAGWHSIPKPLAPIIAAGSRLRLVQKLAEVVRNEQDRTVMEPEVATRLDRINGLSAFDRDPAWRAAVQDHFQDTLERIVDRCQAGGVPLWLCVPASDVVETPPFKVEADPTLPALEQQRLENAWRQILADEAELPGERLARAQAILEVDPHHAGAAYVVGLDAWEHHDAETARKWLLVARDWDVCPLRATTTIEQTVRTTAERNSIPVLDVPDLLKRWKTDGITATVEGIPDPRWFVDHVHPTVAGHQRIAEALADRMQREKSLLPEAFRTAAENADAGTLTARREAISDYLETLDESYFQRGKQRLEGLRRWAAGRAGKSPDRSAP